MRLRFQNQQNRVRSGLAVPAEKRSYVLSARITQESKTQGRRNLGAAVSRYEFRRQKGRERHALSDLSGNFRRIRTHGARRTGLDSPSGSTIAPLPGRIRFDFLAEHYLRADFGADAVRPKSANTISHVEHIVRAYLVPRFGSEMAEDIKPLDIQRWFKSLHETGSLAWTTIAKMRGVMSRIYKVGILHEHVTKNPVLHVETRSKTDYKAIVITPEQTLAILKSLPSPLHFTLVLTCAATALRASEMLALR